MEAAEDRREMGEGFPCFRRLKGGGHYYRIDAPDRFIEVQLIGSRKAVHVVQAKVYPELLRVQEMINGEGGRFEVISEADWLKAYS